ncbi:hypothetical protein [Alkalihalobacterium elongatum]|uniref:hypothetical protein n=1 Tax=Alkalihalobacterium elongatum TaxID=2675466 RepID=UPI001C20107C|nr:hypothetical protein [Alkalihalobacterium elongatum]
MKNRIFYLSLNLFSLLLLIFTFRKTEKAKRNYFIPLYLAFTGLNYFFEFIILIIGKSYEYDPKIMKQQYFDNILGSTVSQLFVVPTTSMFMNMLKLKARWSIFFSLLLSGIERLFVKQNVFKQYWWKTPYTTVGLQFFYGLAKFWMIQVIEKRNKWFELLTIYFSIFVCYSTMNFLHVSLFKTCLFTIRLYKNPYRSHVAISTLYSAFSSIIFVIAILKNMKYRITTAVCSFLMLETLLIKSKIIKIFSYRAFYTASLITKLASLAVGVYIQRLLNKPKVSDILE